MLTRVIEDIASGKTSAQSAQQAMIKLGVAKLPEIEQDNTDRNRTSPFAFTGSEVRVPRRGLVAVDRVPGHAAERDGRRGDRRAHEHAARGDEETKSVDDAVLKVVREAFKETAAIRFEGNNYQNDWVKEAAKRGLPNLRRTPEALAQLITKESRACLTKLGILSKAELESRYHVRLERYAKDMLIEMHTMRGARRHDGAARGVLVLGDARWSRRRTRRRPGSSRSRRSRRRTRSARMIAELQARRDALGKVTDEGGGDARPIEAQAKLLTIAGCGRMADVRECADALELVVSDELWPLPKYREMVFPV